jgi:predicted dienelactone hydrolase
VPIGVWYPTDATEGEAATYIETWVDPASLVDAPFADPSSGCRLPLVVYSHGSQAWGGNASPLLRHLVAQGWVAAAPDHLGNTLIDNVDPRPISFSRTRVADVVAAIDAIEALPEGDPLHDRVDTSRVLVMGHSFGGQTAWLLAGPTFDVAAIRARCDTDPVGCTEADIAAYGAPATDPRVVAVLPLDGSAGTELVANEGWESADRPVVYLSKSQDGDDDPFTRALAADVTWGRFEGACHETFTDSPVSCSTFDKEEGQDLVARFLTAAAARYVLGRADDAYAALLDDGLTGDARVTVRWAEREREGG